MTQKMYSNGFLVSALVVVKRALNKHQRFEALNATLTHQNHQEMDVDGGNSIATLKIAGG